MQILETIMSFAVGVILLMVTALMFRLKSTAIFILLLNAAFGFAVLFILSAINSINITVNPASALITGYLGVFGIILIFLIMYVQPS